MEKHFIASHPSFLASAAVSNGKKSNRKRKVAERTIQGIFAGGCLISHTLLFFFSFVSFTLKKKKRSSSGSSSFKQSKPNADNEGAMEHDDKGEDVLDDDQEEERAEDKAEGEEGEVCDQGDGSDNEQAKKQEEEMMYGVV